MFSACWMFGVYPEVWKHARVICITKAVGKRVRPICILPVVGKMLDKLMVGGLQYLETLEKLSPQQYGS